MSHLEALEADADSATKFRSRLRELAALKAATNLSSADQAAEEAGRSSSVGCTRISTFP
jgi:hypothetical protein